MLPLRLVSNLSIGLVVLMAGCGPPANVGGVSGKVTMDGKPLPDANVIFSPMKEGSSAHGRTDSSGQYSLKYAGGASGAEVGENRVIITTFEGGNPDGDPPRPVTPEKVPAQYNVNTTLKADVKAGSNTFDWELKSGGPVANPAVERPESSCE